MLKVPILDLHLIRCLRAFLAGRPNLIVVGEAYSAAEAQEKAQTLCPDLVSVEVCAPGLGSGLYARHF